MNHISEDELILRHYGDAVRDDVEGHMEHCAECRDRQNELQRFLEQVSSSAEVPEPAPGYEELVWKRLRWQMRSGRHRRRTEWLTAAAAVAALVAIGFIGGRTLHRDKPVAVTSAVAHVVPPAAVQTEVAPSSTLTVAAASHIDRSTRLLLDVTNQGDSNEHERALQRSSAEDLVASNRVYRLLAERNRDEDVAQLLGELEPILLAVAHTDHDLTHDELVAIQQRIHDREILFKLKVTRDTLRQREGKARPAPASAPLS
jgi:hypothetical protein